MGIAGYLTSVLALSVTLDAGAVIVVRRRLIRMASAADTGLVVDFVENWAPFSKKGRSER